MQSPLAPQVQCQGNVHHHCTGRANTVARAKTPGCYARFNTVRDRDVRVCMGICDVATHDNEPDLTPRPRTGATFMAELRQVPSGVLASMALKRTRRAESKGRSPRDRLNSSPARMTLTNIILGFTFALNPTSYVATPAWRSTSGSSQWASHSVIADVDRLPCTIYC